MNSPPGHPKILNNLGKLLHQTGRPEEGIALLEKALKIEPNYPMALNNLGVIYSELGDLAGASRCLEKCVALDPENIHALYNLAGVFNGLNLVDKACNTLTSLLQLEPDHPAANHMLAALSGKTTPTAPREYIEETFDKYAARFDTHIQDKLGYSVPKALADMTRKYLAELLPFNSAIDLGCGTGLSGAPFSDMTEELTGVDISLKMLEKSREKEIYNDLVHRQILPFLTETKARYDLVIAADVFIYLGELTSLFPLLQQKTTDNSVIVCSIERAPETEKYRLLQSGRYGHNPAYLERVARENGFEVTSHQPHNIRKENDTWLAGDLYLLSKTPPR